MIEDRSVLIGELFQHWCVHKPNLPVGRDEVERIMGELMDAGIGKEILIEAIKESPDREWPVQFVIRVRGGNSGSIKGQIAAKVKAERAAAEPENVLPAAEVRSRLKKAFKRWGSKWK